MAIGRAKKLNVLMVLQRQHNQLLMMNVSRRCLDRISSVALLAVVLLSWGFVIYSARAAAQWELEQRFHTSP